MVTLALLACLCLEAPPELPPDVSAALDAVGPLAGDRYDPRPVIAAVNHLQPLGKARATAGLRRYFERHPDAPDGLFAVLLSLYEPPNPKGPATPPACTPEQQEVAQGGCWRPPRLGAPVPAPPEELRSLRFPFFILGDVPLSLVSGYALGGQPEPLAMYLDAIAPLASWRGGPLVPASAGEIRYLFVHYGQWSFADEVGRMVEAQLQRLETLPPVQLDLWTLPRQAKDEASLRAAVDGQPLVALSGGARRLQVALLTLPTDSESYVDVAVWSWSEHFKEWRLVLWHTLYGAVTPKAAVEGSGAAAALVVRDHEGGEALRVRLDRLPGDVR